MKWKNFFVNGISIFLGIIFFTAGMAKVYYDHKFPGIIGPITLEEMLNKYDLGLFARFIGFAQVLIGFMLLTLRYRTLAAIMLLPMVLNILLVTVSMNWIGTPYVLSFFLVLNVILLAADAKSLAHLVGFPTHPHHITGQNQSAVKYGIIWLSGLVLVFESAYLSYFNLTLAYIICATGFAMSMFTYLKAGRAGYEKVNEPDFKQEAVSA